MSCPICINNYNKSTCSKVTCACDYSACKKCIRTYLTTTSLEPHCMNCRNKWSLEFIKSELGASFVNGELKEHQRKILLDSTIAKREERMQGAINFRDDRNDKQAINELKKKINDLKNELSELQDQVEDHENKIRVRHGEREYYRNWVRQAHYDHLNWTAGQAVAGQAVAGQAVAGQAVAGQAVAGQAVAGQAVASQQEERKFIMPCQSKECNGMLNRQYICEICNTHTCSKCFEPKDNTHVCNPDTVATAQLLRKDSKPCPKCGIRISKIDGCDQMWCIECKTAFSWKTGTIETNNIHNPHYFAYLRNGGGQLPLNPDGCRGQQYVRENALGKIQRFRSNCVSKREHENVKRANIIMSYIEYTTHISQVTIPQHEERINAKNNNLTNEYLYILGDIDEYTLGNRLMLSQRAIKKDQAFLDIYRAIDLVSNQVCNEIMQTQFDNCAIVNTINKWSAYFNIELLKGLLLYDSKRDIETSEGWSKNTIKYKNKETIMEHINNYKSVYESY